MDVRQLIGIVWCDFPALMFSKYQLSLTDLCDKIVL